MNIGNYIGYGKIYNKKGKPILHPDEKILKKIKAKCSASWVKKKGISKYILSHKILYYHTGTIYLTNQRFIFIRPPLSWKEVRTYEGSTGSHRAITYDLRAIDMRKHGVMEFIEFYYEEIDEIIQGIFWKCFKFNIPDRDILISTENNVINEVKNIIKEIH